MPMVNSNGKFGTSMDYSMLLNLKKHNVLTKGYRACVQPGDPVFNRDKKTRGFTNGVVSVLFQKGLFLANNRQFGGGQQSRATLTIPYDQNGNPVLSGLSQNQSAFFATLSSYGALLGEYTNNPTPENYQSIEEVLATIKGNMPITLTNNYSSGGTVLITLVGNITTDLQTLADLFAQGVPAGDITSSLVEYTA